MEIRGRQEILKKKTSSCMSLFAGVVHIISEKDNRESSNFTEGDGK